MTWCDALLQLSASSGFAEKLTAVLGDQVRPSCRLVARWSGPVSRVYEGWRADEIASVLDECALVDGDLWLKKVERPDSTGRRLILAYAQEGGGALAYRRRHRNRLNAESNDRMKEWRRSHRPEWDAYCVAYREHFPESKPMGFGRWLRFGRVSWLKYGASGLVLCDEKTLGSLIKRDFIERQDRRSSRVGEGAA